VPATIASPTVPAPNQILLPAMPDSNASLSLTIDPARSLGVWKAAAFLTLLILAFCGLLMLSMTLSSSATEPMVLSALAVLAMVGVFFLFGATAGLIRIGDMVSDHDVSRAVLDTDPDAIQITTADGAPVYVNRAFRGLTGQSDASRPTGLEALAGADPEACEALFRLSRAAARGERRMEQLRLPPLPGGKSRDARWLRIGVEPLHADAGRGGPPLFYWRIADITGQRSEQQSAVDGLSAQLAYYDHLPVGVMAVHEDGRIGQANATLAGWLGLDRARIAGGEFRLSDLCSSDAASQFMASARSLTAQGTARLDLDLTKEFGQSLPARVFQFPLPAKATVAGAMPSRPGGATLSIVMPLAAGTVADTAVLAAGLSERVYNSAPFGIATLAADGRIRQSNAAFTRMFLDEFGIASQSIGAIAQRAAAPEARKSILKAFGQVASGKTGGAPIELALANGGEQTRRLYLVPLTAADGSAGAAVLFAIDTSEQKALERKFAQSQKMEAVGQLAGGVAHDFNNVLTVIINLSDMLLQNHRPTDPAHHDIMQIKQNASRAAGLVRQLLAYSRKQTLMPEVLSVNDVISDLGYSLKRLLGEVIQLRTSPGRDLWLVKADKTQFEQVIINLTRNASDAMPKGGDLTVRTRNVSERESQRLAPLGVERGEYVLCEIEDTGVGMTPELMTRIFEPFFTTKDVGKGTGLGLSTVIGIVRQTGGYIIPESTPGKGTLFRVYLPRHIPDAEDEAAAAKAEREPKERPRDLTGSGRVLLVEDEDAVRGVAIRALKRQGYEVLEASNGVEALEVMSRHKGRIDLVVSDVVMPEMDGPTLMKELRQRDPGIKVILMSGHAEDAFKTSLDDSEQFAFLPKPFTLLQIAAKVKEALGA